MKRASRKGREGRKGGESEIGWVFEQTIYDAFNPVLQTGFAEVDEQAEVAVAEAKLREDLLGVNRGKRFDRLEFHNAAFA